MENTQTPLTRHAIWRELPAYICVDVETAGPAPSEFALLSIGACTVGLPRRTFYTEVKPDRAGFIPEALQVSGLTLEGVMESGLEPREALERLEAWLKEVVGEARPIFVAFNAPFDWNFISDYFQRYLGRNPFGHSALDVKAFYMGMAGVTWAETSMRFISPRYHQGKELSHNALEDAIDQAEIFYAMLEERAARP